MKDEQFWRIVQEICHLLKLNQPSTHHVIDCYKKLSEMETHQFRLEIVISACIYLVSKIQQDERKIRDILNVCYVVTSLYKQANQNKQSIEYVKMDNIVEKIQDPTFLRSIIPNFSLEQDVLEAEQHLLRVLNYDMETRRCDNYKLLLSYMYHFKLPRAVCDMMMKCYNDSIFVEGATENPKATLHFAINYCVRGNIVQKEQLPGCLFDVKWWQDIMQLNQEELLDYGIKMMQYYLADS